MFSSRDTDNLAVEQQNLSWRLRYASNDLLEEIRLVRCLLGSEGHTKCQRDLLNLFDLLEQVSGMLWTMSNATRADECRGEMPMSYSMGEDDPEVKEPFHAIGTPEWRAFFQRFSKRLRSLGSEIKDSTINYRNMTGQSLEDVFSIVESVTSILEVGSSTVDRALRYVTHNVSREAGEANGSVGESTSGGVRRAADSDPESEPLRKLIKKDGTEEDPLGEVTDPTVVAHIENVENHAVDNDGWMEVTSRSSSSQTSVIPLPPPIPTPTLYSVTDSPTSSCP